MTRSKTINIINDIKSQNEYQFVPSVPGKVESYGYTDTGCFLIIK